MTNHRPLRHRRPAHPLGLIARVLELAWQVSTLWQRPQLAYAQVRYEPEMIEGG